MKTFALASGSSGNSFYVEDERGLGVLVDMGLSTKTVVERLENAKINPEKVKAIFVTHEHTDHVRGLDVFARKFNTPIFLTKDTARGCFVCSDDSLINFIKNNEIVKIGGLEIRAFPKPHDCADPVSYSIMSKKEDKTISIITDIGHACKNVVGAVSDSDFIFMESNHDTDMLLNGPYPHFLKKRIMSNDGHLSNFQSSICLLEHARSKLKTIVLSHLSAVNNTPGIALKTAKALLKERKDLNPKIFVSERDKETDLFRV
jgi:phosphoribosyl 1,2-cyclic phosphodiesterase